jgi:hypothetical protein
VAAHDYLARVVARLGGEGLLAQLTARKAELSSRIDLYHWLADATGRPRRTARDADRQPG